MGRGRAKAKQTKVARQLKYNTGGTNLSRLAEELGASPSRPVNPEPVEDDDDEFEVLRMTGQRRLPASESGRRTWTSEVPGLATTADVSRGASNLATVPRAGNVSSDTRAGRPR
jgi:hypothetical protein